MAKFVATESRKQQVCNDEAEARRLARANACQRVRDSVRDLAGRVPPQDLCRIWDSGASQGMTDRSVVSSSASFRGPRIDIETGNAPVSSSLYENAASAPGITSKHICLEATANTTSIGALNEESSVGFSWLPPISRKAGPAFGFKASPYFPKSWSSIRFQSHFFFLRPFL